MGIVLIVRGRRVGNNPPNRTPDTTDPKWTRLTKEMRKALLHSALFMTEQNGSLPTAFRESLDEKNPHHAPWVAYLKMWEWSADIKTFERKTRLVDRPRTEEEFWELHSLYRAAFVELELLRAAFLAFRESGSPIPPKAAERFAQFEGERTRALVPALERFEAELEAETGKLTQMPLGAC